MEPKIEIVREYDTEGNLVGQGVYEPVTDDWSYTAVSLPVVMKFKYNEEGNKINVKIDIDKLERDAAKFIGDVVKQLAAEPFLTEDFTE